jgi:hypothetical protein
MKKRNLVLDKKAIVYLTGKEKDAFDFFTPLRNALRPAHQYELLKDLIMKITATTIYKNLGLIVDIIQKECIISYKEQELKKEKKERKKSNYVMTEEHKKALQEARMKKKENDANVR